MFRAMIVGSLAEAAGASARNADATTPTAIHKRVPRISSLSSRALLQNAARTLLDAA
jgi:hypothetical protein